MKKGTLFIFLLFATVILVGCTRFVTSYSFAAPNLGQHAWKQEYPKDADTGSVKCTYTEAQSGAIIRVVEDPCDKPDVVRSAQSMARLYRESGYDVSEVTLCKGPAGTYAWFTYARGKERGKAYAVRKPNVAKSFLLIGSWSAADDGWASGDIERLAQEFEVEVERVPVE